MTDLQIDPAVPDILLTPEVADHVQATLCASGDLLIWTITANTTDYPHQVAARPHSTKLRAPFRAVLLADTLQDLRERLPSGLTCLPRSASDDPVIVETWL